MYNATHKLNGEKSINTRRKIYRNFVEPFPLNMVLTTYESQKLENLSFSLWIYSSVASYRSWQANTDYSHKGKRYMHVCLGLTLIELCMDHKKSKTHHKLKQIPKTRTYQKT